MSAMDWLNERSEFELVGMLLCVLAGLLIHRLRSSKAGGGR